MKYTIARQFSLKKAKLQIICNFKLVCKVKAKLSKEHNDQYKVKLSDLGEESCIIVPNPNQSQDYLIYLKNEKTKEEILFGELSYQLCGYKNYLYTIRINQKLYQVRSWDLKGRCLIIIDRNESNYPPQTLVQATDLFSKLNKKYHVTVNDNKWQLGYLALVILLDLHECKRNTMR